MRAIPMTPSAGVAIMAAAMLVAPFMDVFSKLLTEEVSPGMTALGRFAAQSLFLLPLMLLLGQTGRPGVWHLVAGTFLAVAILCINSALEVMPVPNALAIFFVEPLILTILSALVLGEGLGWRRLTAVSVGLVGAMVVLRPNVAEFGWAALFPLGTAVAFSCYLLTLRVMSQKGHRIALQFWTGIFAGIVLLAVCAAGTPAGVAHLELSLPSWNAIWLFAGVGLVACISHQMLSAAFARAEAGALAPLQYLEIVTGTLMGWLIWSDFPDAMTWVGTAIIIAAGVYVIRRERVLARQAAMDAARETAETGRERA